MMGNVTNHQHVLVHDNTIHSDDMQEGDEEYYDGEATKKQKAAKDFELRNLEKLREMQELKENEIKKIEAERAKALRRQEKLKQNVLRDA